MRVSRHTTISAFPEAIPDASPPGREVIPALQESPLFFKKQAYWSGFPSGDLPARFCYASISFCDFETKSSPETERSYVYNEKR